MKTLVELISVFCFIGALILFVKALLTPSSFAPAASAIQATQVYSEATFYAVCSGAVMMIGLYLQNASRVNEP